VDFKFSIGFTRRVLVEIKLTSNSKLVSGFTKQLPTYNHYDGRLPPDLLPCINEEILEINGPTEYNAENLVEVTKLGMKARKILKTTEPHQ